MFNKLKYSALATVLTCCSVSASAHEAALDVRLNFNVDGTAPCVITSPLIFDTGTIEHTGVFTVESNLDISCESSDLGFHIMFDEMSSSTHIYKDSFVSVYTGSPSRTSDDGHVQVNGTYNTAKDSCAGSGQNSSNVGGESLYLIGGNISTGTGSYLSKNACMHRLSASPNNEYSINIMAVIVVDTMPTEDDLDGIPESVIVPVTLIPFYVEDESPSSSKS